MAKKNSPVKKVQKKEVPVEEFNKEIVPAPVEEVVEPEIIPGIPEGYTVEDEKIEEDIVEPDLIPEENSTFEEVNPDPIIEEKVEEEEETGYSIREVLPGRKDTKFEVIQKINEGRIKSFGKYCKEKAEYILSQLLRK